MAKTRYLFVGSPRNVGKFGFLETGSAIFLDETEAAAVVGNADFRTYPVAASDSNIGDYGAGTSTQTTAYTVLNTDRLVKCNQSAPVTHTLPAAPANGQVVEFVDIAGNAAAQNITIGRNGKTIDGAAANAVINTNGGSKRLVYDGAGWVSW